MSHDRSATLYVLVAVHLLIATAPLSNMFSGTANLRIMAIFWGLATPPFAHAMLLSIWVGMTRGYLIRKLVISTLAIAYIAVWSALGQRLVVPDWTIKSILSTYFLVMAFMGFLLAILSIAMFAASRLIGVVRLIEEADLPLPRPRFKYSLFALLAVTTATALVLGLVRASGKYEAGVRTPVMVTLYSLIVVVFAANLLTTIWATLGSGHVMRRLFAVFLVALALGLSFASAGGYTLEHHPWWLFLSVSVIVVVPTAIVAVTLLVIRTLGYRLLPPQSPPPEINPTA